LTFCSVMVRVARECRFLQLQRGISQSDESCREYFFDPKGGNRVWVERI